LKGRDFCVVHENGARSGHSHLASDRQGNIQLQLIYLHCISAETADGFQILKMKTSASKFGIWTQEDRTKASGDSF
jgi:hypothetical protein